MHLLELIGLKSKSKKQLDPWTSGIIKDKVFKGPKITQIDITNDCNLNCMGCWCHSDLMGDQKLSGKWKKTFIETEKILGLLKELSDMGTSEIIFAGSGDPLMHPDLMKIIKHTKALGMRINLITNFTLFSKKMIDEIVEAGVDHITASIWAGSTEAYLRTHPNQTEKTFHRIKDNLKYLYTKKKENNLPQIKLYNVISNLNYLDIENMIDFALETMVDFIEFQVIDIVKGKSDQLLLEKRHKNEIKKQFAKIKKRKDFTTRQVNNNHLKSLHHLHKIEFIEFGRMLKPTLPNGFRLDREDQSVRCPHGKICRKIQIDQGSRQAVMFKFDCKKCRPEPFWVRQGFITIMGFGSFYRRISSDSMDKAMYEGNIVDTMPCTIGWTYARVFVNGDVAPCCKAHKKPLGNIFQNSFAEIWRSAKYDEFRKKAKYLKKTDPYFDDIGCYKSCDNVGMNLDNFLKIKTDAAEGAFRVKGTR